MSPCQQAEVASGANHSAWPSRVAPGEVQSPQEARPRQHCVPRSLASSPHVTFPWFQGSRAHAGNAAANSEAGL